MSDITPFKIPGLRVRIEIDDNVCPLDEDEIRGLEWAPRFFEGMLATANITKNANDPKKPRTFSTLPWFAISDCVKEEAGEVVEALHRFISTNGNQVAHRDAGEVQKEAFDLGVSALMAFARGEAAAKTEAEGQAAVQGIKGGVFPVPAQGREMRPSIL